MVRLYLCESCQKGKHGNCDRCSTVPPGHYGGSKCMCGCDGDATWNTPERMEKDLRKLIDSLMDHQTVSRKSLDTKDHN